MQRILVVMRFLTVATLLSLLLTARFADFIIRDQLGKRNVSRTSDRPGAGGVKHSVVAAARATMLGIRVCLSTSGVVRRAAVRRALAMSVGGRVAVFCAALQQNATLLGAVRWRRRKASSDGRKAPFLDVGFDEDEAGLTKVDVNSGGPVGADGREEVLRLEAMDDFFEPLAVAGEENGARARTIADADNIALDELRTVGCAAKGLVVVAGAIGMICGRVLVIAGQAEERVRLGSHANTEQGAFGLFVNLGFPVVDVILFGNGQVAHDGAFRVVEFDFGSCLDKAVCHFELGFKLPGGNALFLDGEVL